METIKNTKPKFTFNYIKSLPFHNLDNTRRGNFDNSHVEVRFIAVHKDDKLERIDIVEEIFIWEEGRNERKTLLRIDGYMAQELVPILTTLLGALKPKLDSQNDPFVEGLLETIQTTEE